MSIVPVGTPQQCGLGLDPPTWFWAYWTADRLRRLAAKSDVA